MTTPESQFPPHNETDRGRFAACRHARPNLGHSSDQATMLPSPRGVHRVRQLVSGHLRLHPGAECEPGLSGRLRAGLRLPGGIRTESRRQVHSTGPVWTGWRAPSGGFFGGRVWD
uniref:(northern house mosquito) hypothetical protein n=2 Tax=Culex pipiens TaxID=7175 RepID=A0A8D8G1Q6_CULPI